MLIYDLSKMTFNEKLKIQNELESLSYWITQNQYAIIEKDPIEQARCDRTIRLIFDALDSLKVPFYVQNAVIAFASDIKCVNRQYLYQYFEENYQNENIYVNIK